jgi:hypothetical protein
VQKGTTSFQEEQQARKRNNKCSKGTTGAQKEQQVFKRNNRHAKGTTGAQKEQQVFKRNNRRTKGTTSVQYFPVYCYKGKKWSIFHERQGICDKIKQE